MLILKLLRAYLTLGVEPDPPADDPPPADELQDALGALDDDPPPATDGDDPPAPDGDEPAPRKQADDSEDVRRRLRESEENLARERAAREADRVRAAGPSDEQRRFDEEERILKDPASSDMQKWAVNSSREIRATRRESQDALAAAYETRDKADWAQLVSANPVLKKYDKRVEEKRKESGFKVDRRVLAKFLIGDDFVEGRIKTKAREPKVVARGNPAPARGDVRRGMPAADKEKAARREKLANQII